MVQRINPHARPKELEGATSVDEPIVAIDGSEDLQDAYRIFSNEVGEIVSEAVDGINNIESPRIKANGFDLVTIGGVHAFGDLTSQQMDSTGATGDGFLDAHTITINDGIAAYTFELDTNSSVAPGNIAVTVSYGDSANDVLNAVINAINGSAIQVTAEEDSFTTNLINLTNDNPGIAGNIAITEVATSGYTFNPNGMGGGTVVSDLVQSSNSDFITSNIAVDDIFNITNSNVSAIIGKYQVADIIDANNIRLNRVVPDYDSNMTFKITPKPGLSTTSVDAVKETLDKTFSGSSNDTTSTDILIDLTGLPKAEPTQREQEARLTVYGFNVIDSKVIFKEPDNKENLVTIREIYNLVGYDKTKTLISGTTGTFFVIYTDSNGNATNPNITLNSAAVALGIPKEEVLIKIYWIEEILSNQATSTKLLNLGITGEDRDNALLGISSGNLTTTIVTYTDTINELEEEGYYSSGTIENILDRNDITSIKTNQTEDDRMKFIQEVTATEAGSVLPSNIKIQEGSFAANRDSVPYQSFDSPSTVLSGLLIIDDMFGVLEKLDQADQLVDTLMEETAAKDGIRAILAGVRTANRGLTLITNTTQAAIMPFVYKVQSITSALQSSVGLGNLSRSALYCSLGLDISADFTTNLMDELEPRVEEMVADIEAQINEIIRTAEEKIDAIFCVLNKLISSYLSQTLPNNCVVEVEISVPDEISVLLAQLSTIFDNVRNLINSLLAALRTLNASLAFSLTYNQKFRSRLDSRCISDKAKKLQQTANNVYSKDIGYKDLGFS